MVKAKQEQEESVGIELKEFSIALGQIAEEKGISQERVIETVEAALSAAYKKDYGKRGQHIRAQFDPEMGSAQFFLVKEVVDETTRDFSEVGIQEGEQEEEAPKKRVYRREEEGDARENRIPRFNPERDILLEDALKVKNNISIGDVLEEELESHTTFGRVAAQTAKQVIIQKIREAERESMFADFKKREGEVVSGTVERVEGRAVYVTVGRSTGVIFANEQSPNDRYRVGQRMKVYVVRVDSDPRGPGIILSRADKELVRNLFSLEVPEIFAKTVEIKAIAREAGVRTKMAVFAREEGIDPIGSCVGQKGTRVQAVIDELGGEKIDIIEWNENPEKFIRSAMSPAKIIRIDLEREKNYAKIIVPEDQLSLAIGRQGQNVRLASRLTEWQLDIVSEKEDKEDTTEEDALSENASVEEEKKEEHSLQEEKREEKEEIGEEVKVEKKAKKVSSPKKKKA